MKRNRAFRRLLEPGYIGKVRTRNRIIKVAALHGWFPYNEGYVPDEMKGFYEAVARGGAGLVVVAHPNLDYPLGLLPDRGHRIDDDRFIPGLAGLAAVIHAHGCPTFLQLVHMGPMYPGHLFGEQPLAASTLSKEEHPQPHFALPRAMTLAEIEAMVQKFVDAAHRAQRAGFDGVELNAGHHHLLNSFVSAAWNKREDAYGGSLDNRARMMVEIVRGIKQRCGDDFPVAVLVNGAEIGIPRGITIEESMEFCRIFEQAGADAIHVRVEVYTEAAKSGLTESTHFPELVLYPEPMSPMHPLIDVGRGGRGGWGPFAAAIKEAVSIPVITIGGYDAETGEKTLQAGRADFIGMNRPLQADPEYPNKIAAGRLDDVVPCTSCLTCFHQIESFMPLKPPRCRINATLGKEQDLEIRPAEVQKKVVVVGGGPAGLEAARVAAMRGHRVILLEREKRLGGLMNVAAVVKGREREDLKAIVKYYERQLAKLGVKVKLGTEAGREEVEKIGPDVLIVATGGRHDVSEIGGIPANKVLTSQELHKRLRRYLRFVGPHTLEVLSRFHLPVGKRVTVVGGGIQGCETAEFLVKRGREVTILEAGDSIGEGLVETLLKPHLLWWFREKGVQTIVRADYGRRAVVAAKVITALPLLSDPSRLEKFKDAAPEVHAIGDCARPGLIVDAIEAGFRVARTI